MNAPRQSVQRWISRLSCIVLLCGISSCTSPKDELEEQIEATQEEVDSLLKEKSGILDNIQEIEHSQKMLFLQAKKIANQQSYNQIGMALAGGMAPYTGSAPSMGDAAEYVSSQESAQTDLKIMEANFKQMEKNKKKLQVRTHAIDREVKEKKKSIQALKQKIEAL